MPVFREKLPCVYIKKWYRAWKIALIEAANPEWRDLFSEVVDDPTSE